VRESCSRPASFTSCVSCSLLDCLDEFLIYACEDSDANREGLVENGRPHIKPQSSRPEVVGRSKLVMWVSGRHVQGEWKGEQQKSSRSCLRRSVLFDFV
jgi:hypothetical protein